MNLQIHKQTNHWNKNGTNKDRQNNLSNGGLTLKTICHFSLLDTNDRIFII